MAGRESIGKSALRNEDAVWQDIRKKAEELRFGNITITLQDGRIVQVETSSKTRY